MFYTHIILHLKNKENNAIIKKNINKEYELFNYPFFYHFSLT